MCNGPALGGRERGPGRFRGPVTAQPAEPNFCNRESPTTSQWIHRFPPLFGSHDVPDLPGSRRGFAADARAPRWDGSQPPARGPPPAHLRARASAPGPPHVRARALSSGAAGFHARAPGPQQRPGSGAGGGRRGSRDGRPAQAPWAGVRSSRPARPGRSGGQGLVERPLPPPASAARDPRMRGGARGARTFPGTLARVGEALRCRDLALRGRGGGDAHQRTCPAAPGARPCSQSSARRAAEFSDVADTATFGSSFT